LTGMCKYNLMLHTVVEAGEPADADLQNKAKYSAIWTKDGETKTRMKPLKQAGDENGQLGAGGTERESVEEVAKMTHPPGRRQ
jgi:hypothetical protein